MKKGFISALIAMCLLLCCVPAYATTETAENITSTTETLGMGYSRFDFLFDGDLLTTEPSAGNANVSLLNEQGIGYLYLIFDQEYSQYIVEDLRSGRQVTVGGYGSLHDCIDMQEIFGEIPTAVSIHFARGRVCLNELMVFSPGKLPSEVQQWKPPAEGKTDIMLLCAHADDEQLFYAGLLPLYAGEKNAAVQVVYLTDHRNLTTERVHEALNGLWASGCDVYPIFADFPDFRIDDMEESYQEYNRLSIFEEDLTQFVVDQLRRFRPQVVVGHDINGEYGHGMHMVYTDTLLKALDLSGDSTSFPKSAQKYGTWEVPKTYLHLYQENPITIDYDQPLPSFNNMTAFEVTQHYGYPCHVSQQYTWFTDWLYGKDGEIKRADQITDYNPCQFGLYRSTVGADVLKSNFLENITTYATQEQLAQDQLAQEQLEQDRLDQEKLNQELDELERLEAERLEQQRLEQQRQEEERLRQEQQAQQKKEENETRMNTIALFLAPVLVGGLIVIIGIVVYYLRKRSHI